MRSRYASAACCGSISNADRPSTAEISVMVFPTVSPKTCPTLEAGSVLTSRTFFPSRARVIAEAHAMEVLPTPPLPVKNRNRGALSRNFMSQPLSATRRV